MKSKYFFKDKADLVKEEHKLFKTYQESTDILQDKCDHKGKVKIIDGRLVCTCGAAWNGPELETLLKLFNGV